MHLLKQYEKQFTKGQLDRFITTKNFNAQIAHKAANITVTTKLVVYGNSANKTIAKNIAKNIQNHWNAPKGTVLINNKKYRIHFIIKGIYFPSLTAKWVRNNQDQRNFFVRIEEDVEKYGVSIMDGVCSNTGLFKLQNVGYTTASTEAHEYGHALGLWPGSPDGHPQDLDLRGKGKPGIMYPRGTWVDPQYQYYPNVAPGEVGGTVNPDKRYVTQTDIDMLFLQQKNWNNKGKIRLGALSSVYH